MFTDTHCHLSKDDYEDIDKVIENAQKNGIYRLIISGCEKNMIKESIEIANTHPNIYLALGYHPEEADEVTEQDILELKEIIKTNNKVVAVGEIGLDYHYGKENKDKQIKLFKDMISIAKELNLPVVIHTRDAFQDTYDILKEEKVTGVIHCFSDNLDNAKKYLSLGFSVGIGGVLTFKNTNLKETVKEIPMDRIILETDSPYLAPVPFRGEKNEPKNVLYVAEELAIQKGLSLEEISLETEKNIKRIFNI